MATGKPNLLRRWFDEVWNQRREDLMEEIASSDLVCHGTAGPNDIMRGLDNGFRPFYRRILGAFPDVRFTIEAAIREGDIEALRWTAEMTHAGDHLGTPATNKPVTLHGMVFGRVENGKIVESWDSWDMMGLTQQIGLEARDRVVPVD